MSETSTPRFGSIAAACRMIGGDKPIHAVTYYRGVKAGIFPAPIRVSPNCSRVDLDALAEALRKRTTAPEAA